MLTFENVNGEEMRVNPDTGRAAKTAVFGIALYDGAIEDGTYTGVHRGNVGTGEEAERWLAGEDVPRRVIYTDEDIAEYQNELDAAEARRLMGCE